MSDVRSDDVLFRKQARYVGLCFSQKVSALNYSMSDAVI